jgi:hypothetical protein
MSVEGHMTQRSRVIIGLCLLVLVVVALVAADALRRRLATASTVSPGEPTLVAGSIPLYVDGGLVAAFQPQDLGRLQKVSFVDAEEGKTQEGWLLRDVVLLFVPRRQLQPEARVTVTSSSRNKSAELTWAEVDEPTNWVLFSLSNRGTLKLVSVLDKLNSRNEWVQDCDRIEIVSR